jgi:hypothetical protein
LFIVFVLKFNSISVSRIAQWQKAPTILQLTRICIDPILDINPGQLDSSPL